MFLTDVCRLCLSETDLRSIFGSSFDMDLKDVVYIATGVEVQERDLVSQKICDSCCQFTIKAYQFRGQCLLNDTYLKDKYREYLNDGKINVSNNQVSVEECQKNTRAPDIQKKSECQKTTKALPEYISIRKKPGGQMKPKDSDIQKTTESQNTIEAPFGYISLQVKSEWQMKTTVPDTQKSTECQKTPEAPSGYIAIQKKPDFQIKKTPPDIQKKTESQIRNPDIQKKPKCHMNTTALDIQKKPERQIKTTAPDMQEKTECQKTTNVLGVPKKPLYNIHPSVKALAKIIPDVGLPRTCLKCNISPVVEMQLDAVENYFIERKLNINKYFRLAIKNMELESKVKTTDKRPMLAFPHDKTMTMIKPKVCEAMNVRKKEDTNRLVAETPKYVGRNIDNEKQKIAKKSTSKKSLTHIVAEAPKNVGRIIGNEKQKVAKKITSMKEYLIISKKSPSMKNTTETTEDKVKINDMVTILSKKNSNKKDGSKADNIKQKVGTNVPKTKSKIFNNEKKSTAKRSTNKEDQLKIPVTNKRKLSETNFPEMQCSKKTSNKEDNLKVVDTNKRKLSETNNFPEMQCSKKTFNKEDNLKVVDTNKRKLSETNNFPKMQCPEKSSNEVDKSTITDTNKRKLMETNLPEMQWAKKSCNQEDNVNIPNMKEQEPTEPNFSELLPPKKAIFLTEYSGIPDFKEEPCDGPDPLSIESVGDVEDNELIAPLSLDKEKRLHLCDICNSVQNSVNEMNKHKQKHLQCQFCKIRFQDLSDKKSHIDSNCSIKNIMGNLPKIVITKIECDVDVRRKYPEAFLWFSEFKEVEESSSKDATLLDKDDSSSEMDLITADDDNFELNANLGENDVDLDIINILSSDEDEPQLISVDILEIEPDIVIRENCVLDNIDKQSEESKMIRDISNHLKPWKLSEDKHIQVNYSLDEITEANGEVTLKCLKRHLSACGIPVEINNGTFKVCYNYKSKSNLPKNNYLWSDLIPIDIKNSDINISNLESQYEPGTNLFSTENQPNANLANVNRPNNAINSQSSTEDCEMVMANNVVNDHISDSTTKSVSTKNLDANLANVDSSHNATNILLMDKPKYPKMTEAVNSSPPLACPALLEKLSDSDLIKKIRNPNIQADIKALNTSKESASELSENKKDNLYVTPNNIVDGHISNDSSSDSMTKSVSTENLLHANLANVDCPNNTKNLSQIDEPENPTMTEAINAPYIPPVCPTLLEYLIESEIEKIDKPNIQAASTQHNISKASASSEIRENEKVIPKINPPQNSAEGCEIVMPNNIVGHQISNESSSDSTTKSVSKENLLNANLANVDCPNNTKNVSQIDEPENPTMTEAINASYIPPICPTLLESLTDSEIEKIDKPNIQAASTQHSISKASASSEIRENEKVIPKINPPQNSTEGCEIVMPSNIVGHQISNESSADSTTKSVTEENLLDANLANDDCSNNTKNVPQTEKPKSPIMTENIDTPPSLSKASASELSENKKVDSTEVCEIVMPTNIVDPQISNDSCSDSTTKWASKETRLDANLANDDCANNTKNVSQRDKPIYPTMTEDVNSPPRPPACPTLLENLTDSGQSKEIDKSNIQASITAVDTSKDSSTEFPENKEAGNFCVSPIIDQSQRTKDDCETGISNNIVDAHISNDPSFVSTMDINGALATQDQEVAFIPDTSQ